MPGRISMKLALSDSAFDCIPDHHPLSSLSLAGCLHSCELPRYDSLTPRPGKQHPACQELLQKLRPRNSMEDRVQSVAEAVVSMNDEEHKR